MKPESPLTHTKHVFRAAILLLVVLIAMGFVGDSGRPGAPNPYTETPWHPGLFALVALATIGVILLGSLYKTSQLASGGEAVALMNFYNPTIKIFFHYLNPLPGKFISN